ncbi:Inner membrane protein YjiY [Corynebacterium oculi]|uniref:Inner membrane protein YjiY n=1 Tax=Corynebacterium oculi TaxID=1544416 RepID=A0A0Q1DVI2_9CORY|nr:Inner membrane protein YjiY [Corynebacterium oculi]
MEVLRNKDTGQPVGVVGQRPSAASKVIMLVIAIVAAVGWAMIALHRGEAINSVWLVAAAVGSYFIAYTLYSRLIAYKVVRPRDDRATPAEQHADGKDFVPTDRRVLFGHHFAAIAGAGPLVGPVMAAQMGYLPSTLWIVLGVIFAGAVQDYLVLWVSTRRRGRSLGQMVRDEMGRVGGAAGIVAVIAIMIIIIAVLALIVVNALAHSPWGVFSIAMTIPIALFMGVYMRYLRPGRIVEVSAIGVIALLAVGIIIVRPEVQMPAITRFAREGGGPVFSGSLFPFLFITIACGALSGFHALISSGTTPKLVEKESQMRMIGYGGMLMESFVAIMALIAAVVIDRHMYFVMNAPATLTGGSADTAATWVNSLGLPGADLTAQQLSDAATAVGEETIISRTGGAPTLAYGMSEILTDVFGNAALQAFWYHFAIMFEALFILTTVDAGTRVARFMMTDTLAAVPGLRRFRDPSWTPGSWIATLLVCGLWGSILLMGVSDPLGGINVLFPLFGIANQLLAAIALSLVLVVVIKKGLYK